MCKCTKNQFQPPGTDPQFQNWENVELGKGYVININKETIFPTTWNFYLNLHSVPSHFLKKMGMGGENATFESNGENLKG